MHFVFVSALPPPTREYTFYYIKFYASFAVFFALNMHPIDGDFGENGDFPAWIYANAASIIPACTYAIVTDIIPAWNYASIACIIFA